MRFIIPVESILQNKGGVILYDVEKNEIIKQYVHNKTWKRTGWRGGVLFNDYLISTDWNDIHYFNIKDWKYERTFKFNLFNDLHYLAVKNNKLYVANTGLDSIEIFENPLKPKHIKTKFVFKCNPCFKNRDIDTNIKWNEQYKTKHSCHPNCISLKGGKIFITCFEDHTRKYYTGKIIELNSGKVVLGNYNCHDGNFNKGNFYLTQTRQNKLLIINDILNRTWPISKPDKKINIGGNGWWRGMILKDNNVYIFSSYGYKNKRPASLSIINLDTQKSILQTIPKSDGIIWDTIYQPCLLKED